MPYSYRDDAAVPAFDDSRPIYIFDGECVLCSRGAGWLMRRDHAGTLRFASAQGALGRALYTHYGLPLDDSYLLLDQGRLYTRTDGFLHLFGLLGGGWRPLRLGKVVPRAWRDPAYALVARHRYRWFGRAGQCALLTPGQRARLIGPA